MECNTVAVKKYNQLFGGSYSNANAGVYVNGYIVHLSASTSVGAIALLGSLSIPSGHKTLLIVAFSKNITVNGTVAIGGYHNGQPTHWENYINFANTTVTTDKLYNIAVTDDVVTNMCVFKNSPSTISEDVDVYVQYVDLTEMYGSGNEPSTVAQFLQDNEEFNDYVECSLGKRQLIANGNFDGTGNWSIQTGYVSLETDDNIATITSLDATGSYYYYRLRSSGAVSVKANHKFYISAEVNPSFSDQFSVALDRSGGQNIVLAYSSGNLPVNQWSKVNGILSNSTWTELTFEVCPRNVMAVGNSYKVRNFMVVDLTKIFREGNEPATVEEFLQKYPQYNNYIPYEEALLTKEYNTVARTKNIWNEHWRNGWYSTDGLFYPGGTNIANVEPIPAKPNTKYHYPYLTLKTKYAGQAKGFTIRYYDENMNYLSHNGTYTNWTEERWIFTTPANCAFINFDTSASTGTYENDIYIYEGDEQDTGYIPYYQEYNSLTLKKYNQLIPNGNFESSTGITAYNPSYSSVSIENGICTQRFLVNGSGLTAWDLGITWSSHPDRPVSTLNHTYISIINVKSSKSYKVVIDFDGTGAGKQHMPFTTANEWTRVYCIFTVTTGNRKGYIIEPTDTSVMNIGDIIQVKEAMLIDLTKMYEGKTLPTTADQFLADYPEFNNYVPYGEGWM